eukprot:m.229306 g.229306  ORF g.229306 m.229306 type:complete len:1041 (+) comp33557_c8_seq2:286-3408(+)
MATPKALKTFKGFYLGSCAAIPGDAPEKAYERASEFAKKREEEDGKPFHLNINVFPTEFVSMFKKLVVQSIDLENVVDICGVDGQPDILIVMTRSLDRQAPIKLAHVYQMKSKVSETIDIMNVALHAISGSVKNETFAKGVKIFDGLYLGSNQVQSEVNTGLIKIAAQRNAIVRYSMQTTREVNHTSRFNFDDASLDQGNYGVAVAEYPVGLVLTGRSMRVVDCNNGETLFKFTNVMIEFVDTVSTSGRTVLGLVNNNVRLNDVTCHMFFNYDNDGVQVKQHLLDMVENAANELKRLKEVGPFTPAKNAIREPAPPELFPLQVHRADLIAERVLGAGEFGEVYLANQMAISRKTGKKIPITRAVKTLKAGAEGVDKNEFLREALIMLAVGKHANIVSMVGVAVQQAPWLVVLEFMRYGDLRQVLHALDGKKLLLTTYEQIKISIQLASGMAHLAHRRLCHADLAARNVLVGENSHVKIADFGMTRAFLPGKNYVQLKEGIRLAIKWSAPEAVGCRFSEATDCWSLAVTIWELFSYGAMPWAGVSNLAVITQIKKGKHLAKPKRPIPQQVWNVLVKCWQVKAKDRPTFVDVRALLTKALSGTTSIEMRDFGLLATSNVGDEQGTTIPGKQQDFNTVLNSTEEVDTEENGADDQDIYEAAVAASARYEYDTVASPTNSQPPPVIKAETQQYGWGDAILDGPSQPSLKAVPKSKPPPPIEQDLPPLPDEEETFDGFPASEDEEIEEKPKEEKKDEKKKTKKGKIKKGLAKTKSIKPLNGFARVQGSPKYVPKVEENEVDLPPLPADPGQEDDVYGKVQAIGSKPQGRNRLSTIVNAQVDEADELYSDVQQPAPTSSKKSISKQTQKKPSVSKGNTVVKPAKSRTSSVSSPTPSRSSTSPPSLKNSSSSSSLENASTSTKKNRARMSVKAGKDEKIIFIRKTVAKLGLKMGDPPKGKLYPVVQMIVAGGPCDGKLVEGDELVSINGLKLQNKTGHDVHQVVRKVPMNARISVVIKHARASFAIPDVSHLDLTSNFLQGLSQSND